MVELRKNVSIYLLPLFVSSSQLLSRFLSTLLFSSSQRMLYDSDCVLWNQLQQYTIYLSALSSTLRVQNKQTTPFRTFEGVTKYPITFWTKNFLNRSWRRPTPFQAKKWILLQTILLAERWDLPKAGGKSRFRSRCLLYSLFCKWANPLFRMWSGHHPCILQACGCSSNWHRSTPSRTTKAEK